MSGTLSYIPSYLSKAGSFCFASKANPFSLPLKGGESGRGSRPANGASQQTPTPSLPLSGGGGAFIRAPFVAVGLAAVLVFAAALTQAAAEDTVKVALGQSGN